MSEARIYLEKRASGQIRARVRLVAQPAPPKGAAKRGALSIDQNLQTDENTGEVRKLLKPLRTEAKKAIREYASAIERQYTKEHCLFLTGTLPGSSIAALEVFSKWQKVIQRRLRQWLADVCASSVAAVIVWEFQKRGALHVHCLVGHEDLQKVRAIRRGFRQYWVGLLERLSTASGADLFERSDGRSWRTMKHAVRAWAQPVRKSVSAYLAKYLSKSSHGSIPATVCAPSRWWGATQKARLLCDSFTSSVRSVALSLSEASAAIEEIYTLCSAAAVPTFRWTRKYSESEAALAACFPWETQEQNWISVQSCLHIDAAPVVTLQTQSRINAPPPSSLEAARLVFGGRLITGVDTA